MNTMTTFDVPLELNEAYPIKSHINPHFIIGNDIVTRGAHSALKEISFPGINVPMIMKVIDLGVSQFDRDMVRNELVITKDMSDHDIAPVIFDMSIYTNEAVIVMKRCGETLSEILFAFYQSRQVPSYIAEIKNLVARMHELGVVHRDLSTDNIIHCGNGKFVIIDYGLAIYSTDPRMIARDMVFIEGIESLYNDINNNEFPMIFESDEDIMLNALQPLDFDRTALGAAPQFLYYGEPINDWA